MGLDFKDQIDELAHYQVVVRNGGKQEKDHSYEPWLLWTAQNLIFAGTLVTLSFNSFILVFEYYSL